MSEHTFGTRRGKIDAVILAKLDKIARRHKITWNYIRDPGQGWLGWFAAPNRGHPFDRELEAKVYADMEKAGIR